MSLSKNVQKINIEIRTSLNTLKDLSKVLSDNLHPTPYTLHPTP